MKTINLHRIHTIILILGLLLGCLNTYAATDCNAVTEISQVECESLLRLYHDMDGLNWKHDEGWNLTNTPCSWYGITCENGSITEINLRGAGLNGTIPNFKGLHLLQRLDLSGNKLTGPIPNFSGLPELRELDLYSNQLAATIPDFSALPLLQTLNLSFNQLGGTIPNLSALLNLETFRFSNKSTDI